MNQSRNGTNRADDRPLMQQLVDGELSHSARSQWLSGVADDSALWRDLALAFVEKQITDEALCDFVQCDFVKDETSAQHPTQTQPIAVKQSTPSAGSHASRSRVLMWVAGLAACLLAGFFVGSEFPESRSIPMEVSNQVNETPAPAVSSIGLADALSRSNAPVPNEFRRALLKAGYALKDRQTIANVTLPSGGRIELPVRDVDVTFVGLSSFQ